MSSCRTSSASIRRIVIGITTLWIAVSVFGCAGFGAGHEPEPKIPQTVGGLKAAIEADRAILTTMASEPIDPMVSQEDRAKELSEIAERLALMQSKLADLEFEEASHIYAEPIGSGR